MDAGVNFFAGYPITPASSIYTSMLQKLQAQGKIAIGASDEIAAISMCIGASMRGAKAMTATAAPGLSLMIENIGYAFASETPLVIVLGQRLGPSTGAATQSAEGDISFVSHLISGGYQIPVIAPHSIYDCYEATIQAINTSEKLRTPVILLTEKDIIMSNKNINTGQLQKVKNNTKIIDRKLHKFNENQVYKTYDFNLAKEVPDFLAAGLGTPDRVVATASFHNKAGELSKNSPEAFEVAAHLEAKIKENISDYSFYKFNQQKEADTLIISFLASDLSAKEALRSLNKVSHLTLNTLFPILEDVIHKSLVGIKQVIIPEVNHNGQYADLLRPVIHSFDPSIKIIKVNSRASLIKPSDILEVINGRVAKRNTQSKGLNR